jgi:nitroreductase
MDPTLLYILIGVLAVVVIGLSGYIFRSHNGGSNITLTSGTDLPAVPPSFLANLKWRRAVKHFAPGHVDLDPIKSAIANAPSSFGIQPYKVLTITDPEVKIHLREACFDQAQVEECYALFVFCAIKDVDGRADEMIKRTGAEAVRHMITGYLKGVDKVPWATHQAYIALGFALAAAAELKIASCPLEGFDKTMLSAMLGLKEIVPVVLLAVGQYKDDTGLHPRFRFDDVVS